MPEFKVRVESDDRDPEDARLALLDKGVYGTNAGDHVDVRSFEAADEEIARRAFEAIVGAGDRVTVSPAD